MSALSVDSLTTGFYRPRMLVFAAGAMVAGGWLVVFGAGGATSLRDGPVWVRGGAAVAFVVGAIYGATRYVDLLAALAP